MDNPEFVRQSYVRQISHVCDGTAIIVGGCVRNNAEGFSIDLRASPIAGQCDVALQVNPRYSQDSVVLRNSFINGNWGKEECGGQPCPAEPMVECILLITNTVIKVAFNGQHYCDYAHRIPKERISEVFITGDIHVQKVIVYGPGMTQESCYGFVILPGGLSNAPGSNQQSVIPALSSFYGGCPSPGFINIYSGSVTEPVVEHLDGGLYHGRQIFINGIPGRGRFTINLRHQKFRGSIVFHFAVQMESNVVIRSSFLHGRQDMEERDQPFFPFAYGYPFSMIIRCEMDKFRVAVNSVHFIEFRHRDHDLAAVQWVEVRDDISNVTVSSPPVPFL